MEENLNRLILRKTTPYVETTPEAEGESRESLKSGNSDEMGTSPPEPLTMQKDKIDERNEGRNREEQIAKGCQTDASYLLQTLTDVDLLATKYPDPIFVVPGLIPIGLTLLAGKPKMGKSLAALAIGVQVARGGMVLGSIPVEQKDVLYMALEDTEKRIQGRICKMLPNTPPCNHIHFAFCSPTLEDGGINWLAMWLKSKPNSLLSTRLAE